MNHFKNRTVAPQIKDLPLTSPLNIDMEHNSMKVWKMIFLLQMGDSQVQNVDLLRVFPWVFMFTINSLRPEMQAEEVDFATRLKGRTTNTGSSGCPVTQRLLRG